MTENLLIAAEDEQLRTAEASEAQVASLEALHETTIAKLRNEHSQQVEMLVAEKEQLEMSIATMSTAREEERKLGAETLRILTEEAELSHANVTDLRLCLNVLEEAQQRAKLTMDDMIRSHESTLRELAEAREAAMLEKDGEHSALVEHIRKDHENDLVGFQRERDAAVALVEQQRMDELEALKRVRPAIFRLNAPRKC